jgi:opacity protein-like surface antigen
MRTTLLAAAALLAAAGPAQAEGWDFSFQPYFMAPYMDGRVNIGPVEARVSQSPSDIFSNLNWGLMGLFEANNGKVGFMVDLTYMDLEADRDGFIDRVGGHQGAYQANVLVRIQEHAEAYAGLRVNDLGVRISGTGPLGQPRSASRSEQWVDPVVGMRVKLPLSRTIDFTLVGDVGGFGIGSDLTYQVWPVLGFGLSNSISAKLGYRAIYSDYETGSGLDRFSYDVLTHGPTLGVEFRF